MADLHRQRLMPSLDPVHAMRARPFELEILEQQPPKLTGAGKEALLQALGVGERVMARTFVRQVSALNIRSAIFNRLTDLGSTQTVAPASICLGFGEAQHQRVMDAIKRICVAIKKTPKGLFLWVYGLNGFPCKEKTHIPK